MSLANVLLVDDESEFVETFSERLAMRNLDIFKAFSGDEALQVLANPWVLGIAGLGALAEFFADKVPWLDSIWDTVHTLVRPIGGALLALAIVDPGDPALQVIAFIVGGGGALLDMGG